ncbi:MAG: adenylate/guanylate cyclase domain-containing protein [Methylococcaceae bacterium]
MMKFNSKWLKGYQWMLCIVLTFIFLAHTVGQIQIPTMQRVENILYDLRLRITMPNTIDDRIVILDIDEKSLAQEGHWPWRRDKLAYLMDMVFDYYGAKIVGFDVVFSEPDISGGMDALDKLAKTTLQKDNHFLSAIEKIRPELSFDDKFAASLKNRLIVMGYFLSHHEEANNELGLLPQPLAAVEKHDFSGLLFKARSYVGNLAQLQSATRLGGYLNNSNVDEDGVYRRLPMITQYKNQLYSTLSLSILQQIMGVSSVEFITSDDYGDNRLEAISVGGLNVPVDAMGNLLVPFRGRQGSFPYISATDVLNGVVDVSKLKDKIVIVGTSAAGLLDLRSTPVQNIYAGVEIHANILSSLLDQTIKSRPTYIVAAETIELVVLLVFTMSIFPRLGAISSVVMFVFIGFLIVITNFYVWQNQNLDTHLATPLVFWALLYGLQLFFGFFFESRRKKQLGNIFGQYIPNELVEEMSKSDDEFSLKGENRIMTVFFSDVRGFTTISEEIENPQDLCDLINDILTPVTYVIHDHKGTIDKYIGDAIMAFWGAPVKNTRHAYHAVKAALDVVESLKGINARFKLKGWPQVDLGIGLNTGAMVVGNMGSQFRIAYTVMGDTVNLGSRLEGLTKQYGVKIIVSESTVEAAPEFAYRELDCVRVKGKNKPITIYEPIAELTEITVQQQTGLDLAHQALICYREQSWDKSIALFQQLGDLNSEDKLCKIYLERIAHYRENPPEANWDGVFTHTSK